MHAKVFNVEPGVNILAGYEDQVYIDGVKIAELLGHKHPELAAIKALGQPQTPLNLYPASDVYALIVNAGVDMKRIAKIFQWINDITIELQDNYDPWMKFEYEVGDKRD